MKKTITKYLRENVTELKVDSIHGTYYMRFELGGSLKNGSKERVVQVVKRALEIYRQTIEFGKIVIMILEYENEFYDEGNKNKEYIHKLLGDNTIKKVKGPFEQIYYEEDRNGNRVERVSEEKKHCDIFLTNTIISMDIAEQIIEGIANLEMGFNSCIPQDVYFFSVEKETGFRIYDDRGCDIWANDKEKLRPIYETLNTWILDYNRKEIDSIFDN